MSTKRQEGCNKTKKHWMNVLTQCFKSILDYELLHFFKVGVSNFSVLIVLVVV